MPELLLNSYNLEEAEKRLCVAALTEGRTLAEASRMLGVTRHSLRRRMEKHRIPRAQEIVEPAAND